MRFYNIFKLWIISFNLFLDFLKDRLHYIIFDLDHIFFFVFFHFYYKFLESLIFKDFYEVFFFNLRYLVILPEIVSVITFIQQLLNSFYFLKHNAIKHVIWLCLSFHPQTVLRVGVILVAKKSHLILQKHFELIFNRNITLKTILIMKWFYVIVNYVNYILASCL